MSPRRRLLALLCSFSVGPESLPFFLLNGLVDFDRHNPGQSPIDLALTVSCQPTVLVGNVMPEKEEVEEQREDKREESEDPDNQGEHHAGQDDGLLMFLTGQNADVFEESCKSRPDILCFSRVKLGLENRIQCQSIDDLSRTLAEYNTDPS